MTAREVPLSPDPPAAGQVRTAAPVTVRHAALRYAPGIVHAVSPEFEEETVVTYTPGQLLPDWVIEALEAGAPLLPESEGVFTLGQVPKSGGKR